MRSAFRSVTRRPWLASAVLVTAVAVAVGGVLLATRTNAGASVASPRLVTVTTGTVRQAVTATGTVEPGTQDTLTFGASGQVTSVRVTAGERVKAGTVLATLNPSVLNASLAQAQAALAGDQAKVVTDTTAAATAAQIAADDVTASGTTTGRAGAGG
jgi:membrane fusion protein, macrolide-specific efflux system